MNEQSMMLNLHNATRRQNRLTQLYSHSKLKRIAQEHANYMARHNKLSHYGINHDTPEQRVIRDGLYVRSIAENIATGNTNVDAVFNRWMASYGHARNILGNYSYIGIGRSVSYDGTVYWCIIYAK
jgi:uncharacterized protein YkwD